MKKCNDCGQIETDEYLEEYGELIEIDWKVGLESTKIYYCEDCNNKYYPEEY